MLIIIMFVYLNLKIIVLSNNTYVLAIIYLTLILINKKNKRDHMVDIQMIDNIVMNI